MSGREMKTKRVAGHKITLAVGARYCAMRPIAPRRNAPVTVSIRELPYDIGDSPALVITVPNREDADKLMRRFNGRRPLDGVVW